MQDWLRVSSSQPGGHSFHPSGPKATGVPALASLRAEPIQDRQVRRPGVWSASRNARFTVLVRIAGTSLAAPERGASTPRSDATGQRERRFSSPRRRRHANAAAVTEQAPAMDRQLRRTPRALRDVGSCPAGSKPDLSRRGPRASDRPVRTASTGTPIRRLPGAARGPGRGGGRRDHRPARLDRGQARACGSPR